MERLIIMEQTQSNRSVKSHFLLSRLLIYGYAHENSLQYIPFDVACLIIHYWGQLWNTLNQITISVQNDYTFDNELCKWLWNDYDPKNIILQFKWHCTVPKHNINILQNYEKQYGVKHWIINCSEQSITFLPFVINTIDKLLSVRKSNPGTLVQLSENEMTTHFESNFCRGAFCNCVT
eukprot:396980_1